jgi:hypothetical protein
MATRVNKHYRLDPMKIKRAQQVLRATTETEAIERALDFVISEHKYKRLAIDANQHLVPSGTLVKDIYGVLEEQVQTSV